MTRRICPFANPCDFLLPKPEATERRMPERPDAGTERHPKRIRRKAGWSALRRQFHPDR